MDSDLEENGDFNVPKQARSVQSEESMGITALGGRQDFFADFHLPTYEDSDLHRDEVDSQKLKDLLKNTFKKSSAMHSIKANLRKEFIKSLSNKTAMPPNHTQSSIRSLYGGDEGLGNDDNSNLKIVNRIIFSAILKFMKQRQLFSSISVFMAETGMEQETTTLTETDIVRMFKFNALSNCFKELQQAQQHESGMSKSSSSAISSRARRPLAFSSVSTGTGSSGSSGSYSGTGKSCHGDTTESFSSITRELLATNRTSLLDILFEFCLSLHQEQYRTTECQTDSNGLTTMEILDNQLNELKRQYEEQRYGITGAGSPGSKLDSHANKSIEERMIAFQRECERRKQEEIEIQLKYFQEHELHKIRREESLKVRQQMESLRQELDFDYRQRLQSHLEREQESSRRLAEQERKMQETLYETRQMMQREIDDLRNRELSHMRKMELESQGLRLLELRLKESTSVLETRERELNKLEKELEWKRQEVTTNIRKEISEQYKEEFQNLQQEKATFMIKQQQLQDETFQFKTLIESSSKMKLELKSAMDTLALKEEEIASLQRHQQRLLNQWKTEEQHVHDLLANVDSELVKYSRPQQLLALIQKNSDLEVKIAQLQDAARAYDLIEQQKEEIVQLQKSLQELQQNTILQQSKLQQEIEKLTKELQIEKAKTAGNTHRMEEMKQLIQDKENLIQSLSKQVQQQQRHDKYSHFGNHGGTSSITTTGMGGNTGLLGSNSQLHSQVTREIDSENRMGQLFDTLFDRLRHEVNFNMLGVPRYDPLTQSVNSTVGLLPSAMQPMQPTYSELAKMPLPGEVNNTPGLASNSMGYGMNYSTDTILMARRLEEEKQRKQREEIEEVLRQKKEQEELMKLKIEKEIRDKYDEENRNMMKTLQIQQKELEMKLENERKAKEQMEKDLLLQQQRRMTMEKEQEQETMKAQQQREIAERLLRERQEEELRRRQEAEIALQQRLLEQQQLQQKEKEKELERHRSQYYSGPVAIASSGVAAAAATGSLNNDAVHYEHVSTAPNPISVSASAVPHSVATAPSFAGLGLSTASISLVDSLAAPSFVNSPVVVRSTGTDDAAEETKRRVIAQEEQEAAARERQQREHEEHEREQAEMERNRLEAERKRKEDEDARIAAELAAKQQKDEEDAAEREWQEMLARKREEDEAKKRKEQEELEKRLKQEEEDRKEKERLRKEAEEAEAARKREAESKRLKELEEQAEADRAAKRQEEEEQRRKDEEEKKKKEDEEAEIRAARERVLARRRQKASYDQQEDERKSTTSVSASVQESNTWGRSSWSNTANTFNSTTNTLRSSTTSVAQASVDESADSEHNVTKFEAGGGSDDSDDGLSAWRF